MPCNNSTKFNNVDHYGDPLLIDQLEQNLKHYFDWAFLCIGAWQEVNDGASGVYGGSFNTLRVVEDANYTDNTVYQGIRKDWVYESGINYDSPQEVIGEVGYSSGDSKNYVTTSLPHNFNSGDEIVITGNAYVGNYSVSESTGTYGLLLDSSNNSGTDSGGYIYGIYDPREVEVYKNGTIQESGFTINYPLGQIYFDSANSSSDTISANYSFRRVQTYVSTDQPWSYELQFDSLNPSEVQWTQTMNSGDYSTHSIKRAQLPAVMIEAAGRSSSSPFSLGNTSLLANQTINITVATQNASERNNITDYI